MMNIKDNKQTHFDQMEDKLKTHASNELKVEQEECDRRFKLMEKLGEGTYGVVYKALDY